MVRAPNLPIGGSCAGSLSGREGPLAKHAHRSEPVTPVAPVSDSEDGTTDYRSVVEWLRSLGAIAAGMAGEMDLTRLVDFVADHAIRTKEARFALVFLADEHRRELVLAGSRGVPADLADRVSSLPFDAPFLSARAASTRRVERVAATDETGAPTRELLARTGSAAMVALPLVVQGRLVGVCTFGVARLAAFTPEVRVVLDATASILAFGIDSALRLEEERRLRAIFEAASSASAAITSDRELRSVLQHIVDIARNMVGAEYGALEVTRPLPNLEVDSPVLSGVMPGERHAFAALFRAVRDRGGADARVRLEKSAPLSTDAQSLELDVTSMLCVAVRDDAREIGKLYVVNKRGRRGFSDDDERAIEILAAHAAAALQRSSLRRQRDRERASFKAIVDHAPHALLVVEAAPPHRALVNRRAVELLGENEANLQGFSYTLVGPDGEALPRDQWPSLRAIRGETVPPQELLLRRKSGVEVPLFVSVARIEDEGQNLRGVVVAFEDISKLKELQHLREEWSAIVTHDLRQPLNVLTTAAVLLQRHAEGPDLVALARLTAQVQRATSSLSRMVTDLADLSLIETNRMTLQRALLDVDGFVQEVVERHQTTTPRSIVLRGIGHAVCVDVDAVRMEQAIANLLVNAIKYSDPDTPIHVDVQKIEPDVRILVMNLGAGIPAADLPKIFGRYYRTARAREGNVRGLGLGLNIVKGLLDAHGGRVWAESTPGATTTFVIALPIASRSR